MALYGDNACKVYCDIDMAGGSLNDHFGCSSVTDHEQGQFTVSFSTNFSNANYAAVAQSENWETTNEDSFTAISGSNGSGHRAVGSFRFVCIRLRWDNDPEQKQDSDHACLAFFGD